MRNSLLRSRFFWGCHATLPPNQKRLLTTEQHSFDKNSQSQLPFHFQEPFRAKFAFEACPIRDRFLSLHRVVGKRLKRLSIYNLGQNKWNIWTTPSMMPKWRAFGFFAPSSLLWGGWRIIVPFYTVQDCSVFQVQNC